MSAHVPRLFVAEPLHEGQVLKPRVNATHITCSGCCGFVRGTPLSSSTARVVSSLRPSHRRDKRTVSLSLAAFDPVNRESPLSPAPGSWHPEARRNDRSAAARLLNWVRPESPHSSPNASASPADSMRAGSRSGMRLCNRLQSRVAGPGYPNLLRPRTCRRWWTASAQAFACWHTPALRIPGRRLVPRPSPCFSVPRAGFPM